MFKVNRKEAEGGYINAEGDYVMRIVEVKALIGNGGREEADVYWKTDDGKLIKQRLWNQQNCWFWLNKLVVATGAEIPDGEEFDMLDKRGEFQRFLEQLLDLPATVVVKSESYTGKDGTQKSNLKVKDVRPVPKQAVGPEDPDI
jgi:hypothetical protein